MGNEAKRRRERVARPRDIDDIAAAAFGRTEERHTRELAAHRSSLLRAHAARRPDLRPAAAEKLSRDTDTEVLIHLARNPAIPRRAAVRVATHPNNEVRLTYTTNPAAAAGLLGALATDVDPVIAVHAAAHSSCSDEHARHALVATFRVSSARDHIDPETHAVATERVRRLWPDEIVDCVELLIHNDPTLTDTQVLDLAAATTGTRITRGEVHAGL